MDFDAFSPRPDRDEWIMLDEFISVLLLLFWDKLYTIWGGRAVQLEILMKNLFRNKCTLAGEAE